jgi:tetratricopeptide (TPR) repeat protein
MSPDSQMRKILIILTVSLTAAFWVARAQGQQQPSSGEQVQTLMTHRQEMSAQAVEEPQRRRFEEGKSDSTFPSDRRTVMKAGVVHVLTPEEQNALRHNDRGLDLFSKGKVENAMKEYQEAIRLDPKLAAAHNNLGTVYFATGRLEEALAAFGHACELDPEYGQAFFNLALTQIKLGHEKEANAALDEALHAYKSAGDTNLKAGRLKEAEEAFQGMLQIDPNYASALTGLAMVYNASRRYEEAAASAERALKQSPNSVDAHYAAGLAYASLGRRDAALEHLARLQQLNAKEFADPLAELINKKAPAK